MTPETKNKLLIWGIVLLPILFTPIGICLIVFGGALGEYHLVHGLPAAAIIESTEPMTQHAGAPAVYKISLRVTPPDGAPFESQAEQKIADADAPSFQPGHALNVKYDPKNLTRVLVVSWPAGAP